MPKESDHCRVRHNVTVMLHDRRSSFLDRIEHFCAAMEPMHFEAHAVAGLQIGFDCFANGVSGNLKIERCSLHHRDWLSRDESQLRVQREGAGVITGLKEANAGNAPFCSSRHAVAHQCASNSPILHSRIDRDRTDACDRRPLIHKIAADDLVIDFGNDSVKSRIYDKLRDQSNRYVCRGQIGRKIMLIGDCCECFITNCAAALCVIRCGCAQLYVHRN